MIYFYKLHHLDNLHECYVGSTIDVHKRTSDHKSDCNNPRSQKYNTRFYKYIRDNGGFDMWRVTVLEQHPFMTKSNKLNRENELIDVFNATLNKQRPGRHTRLGNVEYHKQYNQLHKAHRYVDCICQLCGARYRGKCKKQSTKNQTNAVQSSKKHQNNYNSLLNKWNYYGTTIYFNLIIIKIKCNYIWTHYIQKQLNTELLILVYHIM